jgi:hypothetical protein
MSQTSVSTPQPPHEQKRKPVRRKGLNRELNPGPPAFKLEEPLVQLVAVRQQVDVVLAYKAGIMRLAVKLLDDECFNSEM